MQMLTLPNYSVNAYILTLIMCILCSFLKNNNNNNDNNNICTLTRNITPI